MFPRSPSSFTDIKIANVCHHPVSNVDDIEIANVCHHPVLA